MTNTHNNPSTLPRPNRRTLAIFGATGGIGRQLVQLALDSGHRVTALVRDAARLDVSSPRLRVVEGEAEDLEAVRVVVSGADAVLCALGAPAFSRSRVRSQGARQIVTAMKEQGVSRLLCVSVLGAAESRPGLPFFLRYLFFPLYLRRPLADHELQEEIIGESDLDWTIVRPPFLTDEQRTGHYAFGFGNDEQGLTLKISRADVADFMLRNLDSEQFTRQAVGVSYRKEPACAPLASSSHC